MRTKVELLNLLEEAVIAEYERGDLTGLCSCILDLYLSGEIYFEERRTLSIMVADNKPNGAYGYFWPACELAPRLEFIQLLKETYKNE